MTRRRAGTYYKREGSRQGRGTGRQYQLLLVSGGHFCQAHFRAGTFSVHKQMNARYFVYILASGRNGTLYIGVTKDLVRRMGEHKGKFVPGFTRKYRVDQLVHFEVFESILEARASRDNW